jgi:hypothetical protein
MTYESPQNNNLPDFVILHDGTQSEVSEREQAVVAEKLSNFVDDSLLNYPEEVKHFAGYSRIPPSQKLYLEVPIDETSSWSVIIESIQNDALDDFNPSMLKRKEIFLQRKDNGYGREQLGYRLYEDGVVRRWDGGDAYATIEKEKELGIYQAPLEPGTPIEEVMIHAARNMRNLVEFSIPNAELEKQMGVQDQPVSLSELESLIDMLSSPDVTAAKF